MEEKQKHTKKKNHFFEIYISKVLKQVSPDNGITLNAKQQLNSFLCILLKEISTMTIDLTNISKKKTISLKEIKNALNIVLFGELLSCSLKEGEKACESYSNETKGSRQNRANIIFPPSLIENFLRSNSRFSIASLTPIYLAAVLEFITFEILDISVKNSKERKHNRITVRDMELAVRNDIELDTLFKKYNITFLGGGVVPFIHNSFKTNTNSLALKNIKKQQKNSDSLILAKSPFEKLVRHILKENLSDHSKIGKDVFIILQHFIEQYIIDLLYNANYLTIHAGRIKLIPSDIQLYLSFKTHNSYNSLNKNPYLNSEIVSLLSIENEIDESYDSGGGNEDIENEIIDENLI
jgi:histone H2B